MPYRNTSPRSTGKTSTSFTFVGRRLRCERYTTDGLTSAVGRAGYSQQHARHRSLRCGARTIRFFLPPGAEAFKRDIPNAVIRFFDAAHFALETHCVEIGTALDEFLSRKAVAGTR